MTLGVVEKRKDTLEVELPVEILSTAHLSAVCIPMSDFLRFSTNLLKSVMLAVINQFGDNSDQLGKYHRYVIKKLKKIERTAIQRKVKYVCIYSKPSNRICIETADRDHERMHALTIDRWRPHAGNPLEVIDYFWRRYGDVFEIVFTHLSWMHDKVGSTDFIHDPISAALYNLDEFIARLAAVQHATDDCKNIVIVHQLQSKNKRLGKALLIMSDDIKLEYGGIEKLLRKFGLRI